MTAQDTLYRPKTAWTIAGLLATMMLVNFLDKVVIGLVAVPLVLLAWVLWLADRRARRMEPPDSAG